MISKKQFFATVAVILLVNVIFISGIIIFFKTHQSDNATDVQAEEEVQTEYYEEYYETDLYVEDSELASVELEEILNTPSNDDNFSYLYGEVYLKGEKFVLGGEKAFIFGEDGTFSGYFNDEYTHVNGYTYEVKSLSEGVTTLRLISTNGMKEVRYNLEIVGSDTILLIDPEEGKVIYTLIRNNNGEGSLYEGDASGEINSQDSTEIFDAETVKKENEQ